MKLVRIVISGIAAVGILVLAVWLVQISGAMPAWSSNLGLKDGPSIPKNTGPPPKIVVDRAIHVFGEMAVGDEKKHSFKISNKGEGPLIIERIKISCHCTKGDARDLEIAPGESTYIDVSWIPEKPSKAFEQTATIYTNDPDNGALVLRVRGVAEPVIVLYPEKNINANEIFEEKPTTKAGVIFSPIIDEFKISHIETNSPFVTAKAIPLDARGLKRYKAKSGYTVEVTMAPGVEVGRFRKVVTVHTDVKLGDGNDGANFVWHFIGHRLGPFQILAGPGVTWHPENTFLGLGRFRATEGRKAKLTMFVAGMPDKEFKLLEVTHSLDFLKVTLTPDPKFKDKERKRYFLTFEIPPGSPEVTKARPNILKVRVKTNHPKAKNLVFNVELVSY